MTALLVLGAVGCGTNTETKTVTQTVDTTPDCSAAAPFGKCDAGKSCINGVCVDTGTLCSPTNLNGSCATGMVCFAGGCILETAFCSASNPDGICEEQDKTCFGGTCVAKSTLCSNTNPAGTCAAGETCFGGGCVPSSALCSPTNLTGPCTTGNSCFQGGCVPTASLCSSANPTGTCEAGKTCEDGVCTEPGVDPCTVHVYTTQPTLGMRSVVSANASGTATLNGVAVDDTMTVGYCSADYPCATGVVFKAVASNPADAQFAVGADDNATAANLAAAINANTTASALVTATANAKVITLTAKAPGAAGNGIGMAGKTGKFTFSTALASTNVLWGGKGTGKLIITVDGLQFRDLNGNGTLDPYEDWRLSAFCRAKDLVTKLTLPQKIGLMSEGSALGNGSADGYFAAATRDRMETQYVRQALTRWGFTGLQTAVYMNNLQEFAESLPLGMPIAMTSDPVHGVSLTMDGTTGALTISSGTFSAWPLPLGLGAANDPNLTKKFGDTVRKEYMATGIRWQLGPMADSATEPRWDRAQNTFGEGLAVPSHVRACVTGMQGSATGDLRNGIAATIKHFPGAGPDEDGMDSHTYEGRYNVFPGNNFDYHLAPFQAAFDVGAASIMPCYSVFKGQYQWDPEQVPAAFSYGFITRLAKQKMGFTGMVTGDWGNWGHRFGGIASMSNAQKAALWLKAGSHQLGSDASSNFKDAYDQGLITEEDIDPAVIKILEMTFKLGLYENPYVDDTPTGPAATYVKGQETSIDGFNAQKRAIVMLRNNGSRLPIDGARSQCDTNADGTVKVYYSGINQGLTGSDPLSRWLPDYDYTSPAAGAAKAVQSTDTTKTAAEQLAEADIAVIRIVARKGLRLDAGAPLSFDGPFPGASTDANVASTLAAAVKGRNKIIDAFRVRDGYTKSDGTVVPATNPNLKIVVVMHFWRPGIIKPFINGLTTLNELPGQPGSYPLVSDPANVNKSIVTTSTPTAKAGVDAFLVDFGAFDRAVLDFLFNKAIPPDVTRHGLARLPMEIPGSDADVEAQYEDVPADTKTPTYQLGEGTSL